MNLQETIERLESMLQRLYYAKQRALHQMYKDMQNDIMAIENALVYLYREIQKNDNQHK